MSREPHAIALTLEDFRTLISGGTVRRRTSHCPACTSPGPALEVTLDGILSRDLDQALIDATFACARTGRITDVADGNYRFALGVHPSGPLTLPARPQSPSPLVGASAGIPRPLPTEQGSGDGGAAGIPTGLIEALDRGIRTAL